MKRKGLCILAGFLLVAAGAFMSCKGGTATVDPTGEDETATLNGISVTGAKSSFAKGEVFTYSGISVKGTYSDGSKKTIGSKKCTYKIGSTTLTNNVTVLSDVGSFTVTVSYEGFSASYQINVTKYKIPTYDDNYASISSWSNKSKWNLANTHDPTVIYWPVDGYYYMWGTDASYGNEHLNSPSGKHFPGKRSKDLVSWEYVPGPFDSCPAWVNEKLNEIRAAMRKEKLEAGKTLAENELQPIDMKTTENANIIGYWAPCARVIEVDGTKKIRMYYSIVADYMIGSGKPNISGNFDNTWSERAFIGVCETTNPSGGPGAWKDLGFVTCSSSDKGTDYSRSSTDDWNAYFYFNAIDPTYFVDDKDGSHWMIYGSWHSGFALTRINPKTGKIAAVDGGDYLTGNVTGDFVMGNPWASDTEGLAANGYGTRIYTRDNSSRWQGSEGPELIKYNKKYYLFFANDPLGVPYQTRVVVADKITGPYIDINKKNCTAGTGTKNPLPMITHPYKFDGENDVGYGWVGISHCAIFQAQSDLDGDGEIDNDWFYMSQGRFPEKVGGNAYSNALMMGHVRRLEWVPAASGSTDLWPMVSPERYGGIEKLKANELTAGDIEGTWEHITLTYSKNNMNTSSDAVFVKTSDNGGTVSGALNDSWTFDPATNLLKIGTSVVKVEREVDWEKNPTERTVTLVYSGIAANNLTKWGKKVSETVPEKITLPYTIDETLSASKNVSALGSLISEKTGLSVSFKLKLGSAVADNTYEWETPVQLQNGTQNVYIDVGPLGVWLTDGGANLFEASATRGSEFSQQDNWTIFCQDGTEQFVTINFNTDGSIVYYKNGNPALTYAADTAVKGSITVADGCKFAINTASTNGIILHATTAKTYTMSNVIIDVAKTDSEVLTMYNSL
ncbi:MAG: glycoside hydrolase family 43 protein [Treponema sp.]|nr:glycoside hydrolase family 43 protein [Treponema sp.]